MIGKRHYQDSRLNNAGRYGFNNRDVFSHSAECDQIFSIPSPIIGGVPHVKCRCWCHNAQSLYGTPEPEYDLTPPPEYQGSFDAPFLLDEPEHVKVGFTNSTLSEGGSLYTEINEEGAVISDNVESVIAPSRLYDPVSGATTGSFEFTKRSALELATGKCDTCGDKLADCECVE